MAKVVWQDGIPYRWRRGKLVEIPPEWFGRTTYQQTKRKRRQKLDHGRFRACNVTSWAEGNGLMTRQEKKALLAEREQLKELLD